MKKAAKAKAAADFTALLVAMASFYAGKPVTVNYGDRNTTGIAGSSRIEIDPQVRASLEKLLTNKGKGPVDPYGLGTLIHEALHTRGPDMHDEMGRTPRDPHTGFYSWDDEWQARQLGYQLVPDAMQRFFGVPMNSKRGKDWENAARGAGPGFGSPPPGSIYGNRVTTWDGRR